VNNSTQENEMKVTRILSLAGLALLLAGAGGCKESYTLRIINYTSEIQNIQITDSGGFPEAEFSIRPDGGKETCVIKQESDTTEGYTLRANQGTRQFTLSKRAPNPGFIHITMDGIIGPVDENAKVTAKWDHTTNVRSEPIMKVE